MFCVTLENSCRQQVLIKGTTMSTMVAAVYERGALRLLDPLPLPEASTVHVQILTPWIDDQTEAFVRQLTRLHALLNKMEDAWESDLVRVVFIQLLQTDLQTLWHLAQPQQQTLCSLLQLATVRLRPEQLTHDQMAALRFTLNRLAQAPFSEADIQECHVRLLDAHFPAAFTFSPEVVQSYLDEL